MCRGGTANIYWLKDAQDGATKQAAKGKTKEEIYGWAERGYADSWSDLVEIDVLRFKEIFSHKCSAEIIHKSIFVYIWKSRCSSCSFHSKPVNCIT